MSKEFFIIKVNPGMSRTLVNKHLTVCSKGFLVKIINGIMTVNFIIHCKVMTLLCEHLLNFPWTAMIVTCIITTISAIVRISSNINWTLIPAGTRNVE